MSDLCPHGDVPAACIDCLEGVPPERPNPPTLHPEPVTLPFAAKFPGRCAGCNLEIHEGQTILRMDDGTYCHNGCGAS